MRSQCTHKLKLERLLMFHLIAGTWWYSSVVLDGKRYFSNHAAPSHLISITEDEATINALAGLTEDRPSALSVIVDPDIVLHITLESSTNGALRSLVAGAPRRTFDTDSPSLAAVAQSTNSKLCAEAPPLTTIVAPDTTTANKSFEETITVNTRSTVTISQELPAEKAGGTEVCGSEESHNMQSTARLIARPTSFGQPVPCQLADGSASQSKPRHVATTDIPRNLRLVPSINTGHDVSASLMPACCMRTPGHNTKAAPRSRQCRKPKHLASHSCMPAQHKPGSRRTSPRNGNEPIWFTPEANAQRTGHDFTHKYYNSRSVPVYQSKAYHNQQTRTVTRLPPAPAVLEDRPRTRAVVLPIISRVVLPNHARVQAWVEGVRAGA